MFHAPYTIPILHITIKMPELNGGFCGFNIRGFPTQNAQHDVLELLYAESANVNDAFHSSACSDPFVVCFASVGPLWWCVLLPFFTLVGYYDDMNDAGSTTTKASSSRLFVLFWPSGAPRQSGMQICKYLGKVSRGNCNGATVKGTLKKKTLILKRTVNCLCQHNWRAYPRKVF